MTYSEHSASRVVGFLLLSVFPCFVTLLLPLSLHTQLHSPVLTLTCHYTHNYTQLSLLSPVITHTCDYTHLSLHTRLHSTVITLKCDYTHLWLHSPVITHTITLTVYTHLWLHTQLHYTHCDYTHLWLHKHQLQWVKSISKQRKLF